MPLKGYAIHTVKLNGAAPFTFAQLTEDNLNPRQVVIYNRGSGRPSPSMAAVADISPELTMTLNDIGRVFGIVSPSAGLAIAAAKTYTSIDINYQQKEDLGLRMAGANHLKRNSTKAIMVPATLEVSHGKEATLSLTTLLVSSDGITSPISTTNNVTLTDSYASEKWTLGGVVANGVTIPGVESISIDFGFTIHAKGGGGQPYVQYATIDDVVPRITLRTPNMDVIASYPESGTKLTTGAMIYLRKMQDGTTPYPDASVQHLAFVVQNNQGILLPGPAAGQGAADANQELNIMPLEGASGAILSVTTPTAIVLP
jgi:hypothetical protein